MDDVQLVHRHYGQEKELPILRSKDLVFLSLWQQGQEIATSRCTWRCVPCLPRWETITLRGRIYADYTFNLYRDGKAVATTHFPSRSTPSQLSFINREFNRPSAATAQQALAPDANTVGPAARRKV